MSKLSQLIHRRPPVRAVVQPEPEGKYLVREFSCGDSPISAICRSHTMDSGIFAGVYHEYRIASLVESLAGRRSTVVDIGGHIGSFSLIMAHLLPELESHIYEFMPENCRLIRANICLNGLEQRVRVHNRAVTDRSDGHVQVKAFREGCEGLNTGGVCIARPSDVSLQGDASAVSTIAAKDVVAGLGYVDVLKIDCEASEYRILFSLDKEDYRKIGLITGEIHDGQVFHEHQTNGRHWQAPELVDYLRQFYRTVTIHSTTTLDWGYMQTFTAAVPC